MCERLLYDPEALRASKSNNRKVGWVPSRNAMGTSAMDVKQWAVRPLLLIFHIR